MTKTDGTYSFIFHFTVSIGLKLKVQLAVMEAEAELLAGEHLVALCKKLLKQNS